MNNTNNINNYKITPLEAIGLTIIAIFGGQLIGGIVGAIGLFLPNLKGFIFALSFALSFGISAIIIMLLKRLNFKDIFILLKSSKNIKVFAFATLLYIVSFPIIEFLVSLIPTDAPYLKDLYEFYTKSLDIVFKNPIAAFISVSILAPILEELIFRGLLLRGLLNNKVNPWLSITLVAILFGTAHLNPWQFMGAGFLGFIFGFIYWRTKDLWICIFLHFLNNTLSFVVSLQQGSLENQEVVFPPIYLIISIFLLISLGYLFYKHTEQKKLSV